MRRTPDLDLASLRWIAAVLGGAHPPWDAAALCAPEALAQLAEDQGVAALLLAKLNESAATFDVPQALRKRLAMADLQARALETRRALEDRAVVAALRGVDCTVLVLKGAAVARWAYAEPHHRTRADLDLLFRDRAEIDRSAATLVALGYRASTAVVNGISYETPFVRDDGGGRISAIDAHWRMANHPLFADRFTFDELLAESVPLGDAALGHGLGIVHAFMHAALHRISNLVIGAGDRLIWLYDLHLMASRLSAAEWTQLSELAATRQLAGPCASAMHACSAWFRTSWPDAVLRRLDALALREAFKPERAHWRWYHEWMAFRSMRVAARPRFILHKFFPQPQYMRERYAIQHAWQLPLAYLRRWWIGLGIFGRYLRNRRPS